MEDMDDLLTMLGLALIVVPIVAAVAAVLYFLPGTPFRPTKDIPRRRVAHDFDPVASDHVTGGARVGSVHASWPFCRLDIDSDYVRATVAVGSAIWISRDECIGVREIFAMGHGVFFETAEGLFDGFVFFPTETSKVLTVLVRFGWPVQPQAS